MANPLAASHQPIVGSGQFRDVKSDFFAAAKNLPPGMLATVPHTELYGYLGSLEMLDPKMDCGLVATTHAAEMEFDVLQSISPAETLDVIDRIIGAEAAWHQGHSFGQSLFSCHYVQAAYTTDNATKDRLADMRLSGRVSGELPPMVDLIRMYALGTLKTCQMVIQSVRESAFYEDEDISIYVFGRPVYLKPTATEASAEMAQVASDLDKMASDPQWRPFEAVIKAIRGRFSFREKLLKMMAVQPLTGDEWIDEWAAAVEALDNEVAPTHKLCQSMPTAFSLAIQTRLSGAAPPRPMAITPFDEAIGQLRHMCEQCSKINKIRELPEQDSVGLLHLIQSFTEFETGVPFHIYTRSSLYRAIFINRFDFTFNFGLGSLRSLVLPNYVPIRTQSEIDDTEELDFSYCEPEETNKKDDLTIIHYAIQEVVNPFIRAFFYNKCRTHRLLIGEAAVSMHKCEKLYRNENLRFRALPNMVADWASICKYDAVALWLEHGYKLDLYQKYELGMIYNVWDCVLSWQTTELRRQQNIKEDEADPSGPLWHWDMTFTEFITSFLATRQVTRMAEALMMKVLALLYPWMIGMGLIQLPQSAGFSLKRQFESRFRPFVQANFFGPLQDIPPGGSGLDADPVMTPDQACGMTAQLFTRMNRLMDVALDRIVGINEPNDELRQAPAVLSDSSIELLNKKGVQLKNTLFALRDQVKHLDRIISWNISNPTQIINTSNHPHRLHPLMGNVVVSYPTMQVPHIVIPHFDHPKVAFEPLDRPVTPPPAVQKRPSIFVFEKEASSSP